MLPPRIAAAACLLAVFAALRPGAAADTTPATHRVGLVPFRIETRVEGVFESPRMAEVHVAPKRWTQMVVQEAVAHGTRVGKGDLLVKVETDKLDETIRDQEIGGRLAAVAHALMERELAALEKSTPRQLELARRARRIAEENLKRYEDKEGKLAEDFNDIVLRFHSFQRENSEEELAQLEKMYEQDDLTEETEAIVLKRARFDAEIMRFLEHMSKDAHERAKALDLPRQLEAIRTAAESAILDQERAEAALPLAIDRLRLELEKSTQARRQAADQLAALKADRQALPITAPADGVVYYGRWKQGKWIDGDNAAQRLRPGGQLDPREIVITIVGDGKLHLRAAVPEKDFGRVPVDAVAKVAPRAFPELPLAGRVRSVGPLPIGPGRFEAVIDLIEERPQLVAGMEADIRVVADFRAEVLAVPRKAVFTDEIDDAKRYVLVASGQGQEAVRRTVAVGRSNDELVEITAGLAAGEEILLEKPARKEPAATAKPAPASKPEASKPDTAPAAANASAAVPPANPGK